MTNSARDCRYVYIGDISKQDAGMIAYYANKAQKVLEFGVGGSTQIFAQCCPIDAEITCVDTSLEWIGFVKEVLEEIRKDRPIANINFMTYEEFFKKEAESFDLILDDGLGKNRLEFALKSWPYLNSTNGIMLFHDTRRTQDYKNVTKIIEAFYNEIERVELNQNHSNISAIIKKPLQNYENWNPIEKKESWMKSARIKNRPKDWISIMRDFIYRKI